MRRGVILLNAVLERREKLIKRRQLLGFSCLFDFLAGKQIELSSRVRVHVVVRAGIKTLGERGTDGFDRYFHKPFALRNGRDRMLGDNAELRQNTRAFSGEHGVFVARPVVGIEKLRNAVAHASRPECVQYGEAVF